MNPRYTRWTKEMDQQLENMWPRHSAHEIAKAMGLTLEIIRYRVEKLQLPGRSKGALYEPPAEAWITAARFYAKQEDVSPQLVLSGHRAASAVIARRKAVSYMLRSYPRAGLNGLARVSGFDSATISRIARQLAAKPTMEAAE